MTDRNQDTTCLECQYFHFRSADGWAACDMECLVNEWFFDDEAGLAEFRKCLKSAATCHSFARINE